MTSKPKQPAKTPMEKFTEAASRVFTLPKRDVEKIKAKTPSKSRKRR